MICFDVDLVASVAQFRNPLPKLKHLQEAGIPIASAVICLSVGHEYQDSETIFLNSGVDEPLIGKIIRPKTGVKNIVIGELGGYFSNAASPECVSRACLLSRPSI